MKKNTLRTLWLSLTVMLIFCIIVFTGLANYTVTQSDGPSARWAKSTWIRWGLRSKCISPR